MPDLKNGNGYFIVTDEEKAIINAIQKHLPKTDLYRCWNHIKRNIKLHFPANLGKDTKKDDRENTDDEENWLISDNNDDIWRDDEEDNENEDDDDEDMFIKYRVRTTRKEYYDDVQKLFNQKSKNHYNSKFLKMKNFWDEVRDK